MPAEFTKITPAPFPVGPGQTPYLYAVSQGGRTFVAEAVRPDEQPEDFLVLEVSAWEVDGTGSTVTLGNVVVATPPRRVSIHLDALAEGLLTVDSVIQKATQGAADRLRTVRAQLDALEKVPKKAPQGAS